MFNDIFWATIGFIFLSAIVGVVVRRRRRDACLRMMDGHHVTLVRLSGRTIWGDVDVHSQGLELRYDADHRTADGLVKSSYLLYEDEMAQLLALCRFVGHLTPEEQVDRNRQVERSFRPSPTQQALRGLRNTYNLLRDAFARALSVLVGHVARSGDSKVLATQKDSVDAIGQTLLKAAGNAYEPMLERHIGEPVVLELVNPSDPEKRRIELAGYLAEYTDTFVAVFNVEHPIAESHTVPLADGPAAGLALTLRLTDEAVEIVNDADAPLVVEGLSIDGGAERPVTAVVTCGGVIRLARPAGARGVRVHRVPRIDVVCPRQYARVRHASASPAAAREDVAPNGPLAPAHEDQSPGFP